MWGVGCVRVFVVVALVSAAAILCAVSPAQAQCLQSGQTVTCTGNDPDGFAAGGGDNNLTVNVQPGANVFDNGTDAIFLNDGNTVTNRGTVTAAGTASGIASANSNTINNVGTIAVVNGVAISVQDNSTVINSGAMSGADNSTGILGGQNGTITNAVSGTITLGNDATGIFVSGASGGNLVTNFGVIAIGDSAGLTAGIVAINDGNTVINEAGASITAGQFNAGIATFGNNVTITNRGAIATGDDGGGISAQGDNARITNTGTITAGNGFTFGVGVSGNSNTINNGGTITVGDGVTAGILVLGDSNTITNSGTINVGATGVGIDATTLTPGNINQIINTGTINVGVGGTGIRVSDDGNVFNAGTINAAAGAFAIDFCFCSPASSLTLAPTSVINGLVQGANTTFQLGGTGTGTFNLDLIGAGRQYDGFATFNKVDASTWTLTGTGNQDWNVLGGTLAVNGTLTGTLTVNSGTVGGTGILGNTTINGGTLAPGNSIGTITINGNLVLAAAATYAVEIGGGERRPHARDRNGVACGHGAGVLPRCTPATALHHPDRRRRRQRRVRGAECRRHAGRIREPHLRSQQRLSEPDRGARRPEPEPAECRDIGQHRLQRRRLAVAAFWRAVCAERRGPGQRAERIVRRDRDAERAGRVQLGRLLPQPDARSVRLRPRRRCRWWRARREPVCS